MMPCKELVCIASWGLGILLIPAALRPALADVPPAADVADQDSGPAEEHFVRE